MDKEQVIVELTIMAKQPGATACMIRAAARAKLGNVLEHPLIVHSPQGPAMRIYSQFGTLWVPVPASWMKV